MLYFKHGISPYSATQKGAFKAKNKKTINVEGTEIALITHKDNDYISLTDIAKNFEVGVTAIESWMRNRNTVEFLGTWEKLYNADFNSVGFDGIKANVGLNSFKLSVKNGFKKLMLLAFNPKLDDMAARMPTRILLFNFAIG